MDLLLNLKMLNGLTNDFFNYVVYFVNIYNYFLNNILFIIVIIPLLTIIILSMKGLILTSSIYQIALTSAALNVLLTFILWKEFEYTNNNFQFCNDFLQIPGFNYTIYLGIDGISLYFVILTNIIILFCIISISVNFPYLRAFLSTLFLLQIGVLCSFLVLDLLSFFVFFETTLIPIFFIIIFWGSRGRKVRASYLISLYTLAGSIFMLFNIIYLAAKIGSTNYLLLKDFIYTFEEQKLLWITFFIAFAVKIPLIPTHIWLPEAHVEAPTIGSVILAALLLKLGGYGFIRYNIALFPLATIYYTPLVHVICLLAILYTGFTSIRQVDLKKIIAYSSIGHMAVIIIGIMAVSGESLSAAIYQMISHGFISSGLFFCVGVLYDRYATRYLTYYGGLIDSAPGFSTLFFLFSLANISFPLTSNFIGEFGLFISAFKNNHIVVILASLGTFLITASTLWTYNRVIFGAPKDLYGHKFSDINYREQSVLFGLIFFVLFLGIIPNTLLEGCYFNCLEISLNMKYAITF